MNMNSINNFFRSIQTGIQNLTSNKSEASQKSTNKKNEIINKQKEASKLHGDVNIAKQRVNNLNSQLEIAGQDKSAFGNKPAGDNLNSELLKAKDKLKNAEEKYNNYDKGGKLLQGFNKQKIIDERRELKRLNNNKNTSATSKIETPKTDIPKEEKSTTAQIREQLKGPILKYINDTLDEKGHLGRSGDVYQIDRKGFEKALKDLDKVEGDPGLIYAQQVLSRAINEARANLNQSHISFEIR